ncbi:hypothetical protein Tco_0768471 [Tanacetum coccineum]
MFDSTSHLCSRFLEKPALLCLTKENYVPWSSRLLRYAKSRPNGKVIYNSIMNGPYVRRMIPEPGLILDSRKKAKLLRTGKGLLYCWKNRLRAFTYHRFSKMMMILRENKHFHEKIAKLIPQVPNKLKTRMESASYYCIHLKRRLAYDRLHSVYDLLKYNQKEVRSRVERTAIKLMIRSTHGKFSTILLNYPVFPPAHQSQSTLHATTTSHQQHTTNPQPSFNPGTTCNNQCQIPKTSQIHNRNEQGTRRLMTDNMRWLELMVEQFRKWAIGVQNIGGMEYVVAARADRPRRRDAVIFQTQLLIAQKEEEESNPSGRV